MYDLEPIWNAAFSIYQEVERICERHDLRLFGSFGTALGAVRHKGFIPWDDDFDVSMPRPDFDRFMKLAPQELPDWLKLLSWRNCHSYLNLFPKVIMSDREKVDDVCGRSGLPAPQGIFIDVFPIDGYPVESYWGKKLRLAGVAASRLLIRFTRDGKWNRIMNYTGSMFSYDFAAAVVDWDGWVKEERKFATFDKAVFMRPIDFGYGIEMPFMDGSVRIPYNYDRYLTWLYGDYMTLPPEANRQPSHTVADVTQAKWRLGPC